MSSVSRAGRPFTMIVISSRLPRLKAGEVMNPVTEHPLSSRPTAMSFSAKPNPRRLPIRSLRSEVRGAVSSDLPLWVTLSPSPG